MKRKRTEIQKTRKKKKKKHNQQSLKIPQTGKNLSSVSFDDVNINEDFYAPQSSSVSNQIRLNTNLQQLLRNAFDIPSSSSSVASSSNEPQQTAVSSTTSNTEKQESSLALKEEVIRRNNERDLSLQQSQKLILSLEESFFLKYVVGDSFLKIKQGSSDLLPLTLQQCWTQFNLISSQFMNRYVVYHFYRSKGYVVKSGLKYGVDYILYQQNGPSKVHASHSILVADSKFQMKWKELQNLNRLTLQIAKVSCRFYLHSVLIFELQQLRICYVVGSTDNNDCSSVESFKKLHVRECNISRFVAEKER